MHTSRVEETSIVFICASWLSSSRGPVEDFWKVEQVQFNPPHPLSQQTEMCLGILSLSWSLFEHEMGLMVGRLDLGLEVGEMTHQYIETDRGL